VVRGVIIETKECQSDVGRGVSPNDGATPTATVLKESLFEDSFAMAAALGRRVAVGNFVPVAGTKWYEIGPCDCMTECGCWCWAVARKLLAKSSDDVSR